MTDAGLLEQIILDVDWSLEPSCESLCHEESDEHDGPARYRLIRPCGCRSTLACELFCKSLMVAGAMQCQFCGKAHIQVTPDCFVEI